MPSPRQTEPKDKTDYDLPDLCDNPYLRGSSKTGSEQMVNNPITINIMSDLGRCRGTASGIIYFRNMCRKGMKAEFLAMAVMLAIPLVAPQGFSICVINEDWPDAPCFDMDPVSEQEYRSAWAPYYDHKGAEFMEGKRIEMNQALEDGVLGEWAGAQENHNVYSYYRATGEIQSQFAYDATFLESSPQRYLEIMILAGPAAAAAGLAVMLAVRRREK